MIEAAQKRALEPEKETGALPLVLEILPGQAGEGLIDIYPPGSYEGQPLAKLVEETLQRTGWSIEERQILDDIRRQMKGGRFICRGGEIHGDSGQFAVVEETESGERYWYVPVRVIRPQEGGSPMDRQACPGASH
ncbi:MAG: hypothetical protein GX443_08515 [Deltaproteobacteria bacterium]|nr:hypothetical protein [Deltaproteobacteria bacterium]